MAEGDFHKAISSHLSLNREGRWGTTDDFTTSFLYFPLLTTALWDLANSTIHRGLMWTTGTYVRYLFL